MNKIKGIDTIGPVIVFFILLVAFFKFGPKIPFSITTQQKGEPLVVSGEGKVSVVPDIAKVTLGIQENGTYLKTLQDSVNKKSKTLVDSFDKLGIDKKNIKTTSYNIYPQYNYDNSTPRITGYQVSTNYVVTIEDFNKVNDVLVLATQEGANIVGDISFEVNDETKNKKLQEARGEAVKEAKEKAEGLARAAGISLGKIINISESQGNFYPRPMAVADRVGTEIAKPDIQPGETELSITVALSYEVR